LRWGAVYGAAFHGWKIGDKEPMLMGGGVKTEYLLGRLSCTKRSTSPSGRKTNKVPIRVAVLYKENPVSGIQADTSAFTDV